MAEVKITDLTAIRSDSGLFVWGYGYGGQLGLNDMSSRSSPVQLGSSSWVAINAFAYHVAGTKNPNQSYF